MRNAPWLSIGFIEPQVRDLLDHWFETDGYRLEPDGIAQCMRSYFRTAAKTSLMLHSDALNRDVWKRAPTPKAGCRSLVGKA